MEDVIRLAPHGRKQRNQSHMRHVQDRNKAYRTLIARTRQFQSATELKALRCRKGGFHPPQSDRHVGSEESVELMN